MKVLITGATGLVGREIGKKIASLGHQIFVVSRSAEKAKLDCPFLCEVIEGSLDQNSISDSRFKSMEAVIHLAGESVAESRWSDEKKKRIHDSRSLGTKHLIESLSGASLKVFLSTSASGYYGDRKNEILDESSLAADDFLAAVCKDWESPIFDLQKSKLFPDCRFAIFRVGVVLSAFGGAMLKMIPPFRRGVGGAVGTGQQWMSWIHLQDLTEAYVQALTNSKFSGVINAVSPEPLQNKDFSEKLAKALDSSLAVSIPTLAVKAIFGEMSHVLLSSQQIECKKLKDIEFKFQFPTADKAFEQIASFYQNGDEIYYAEQFIPAKREYVFPFFSEAKNLEEITPPLLNFKVLKMSTDTIQSGTLIDYRLKIHGIPVGWQTEILDWQPISKFTDTQLKGPYTKWHHTHEFFDLAGGTLMTDLVRYKLPLGPLGWVVAGSFVAKDIKQIFLHRKRVCAAVDFKQRAGF